MTQQGLEKAIFHERLRRVISMTNPTPFEVALFVHAHQTLIAAGLAKDEPYPRTPVGIDTQVSCSDFGLEVARYLLEHDPSQALPYQHGVSQRQAP